MKTILITGASSGIGRAAALYFQKKGWGVAATMRSPDKEKELAELANIKCLAMDVTRPAGVKSTIAKAIEIFGGIDVVLNNAGFSLIGCFENAPEADVARQFDTNLFGIMNVMREILPHFRSRKAGTIINVASIGGRIGFPLYSLYNSSKFAVEGFSESIQHELRPLNIRVKIIEPGVIKTDFYGRSMVNTYKEGQADYDAYVKKKLAKLMDVGRNGITPDKVAKKIYKAAKTKSWRMRYSVGPDAKAVLFMRRILPFRFFRWVLAGIL